MKAIEDLIDPTRIRYADGDHLLIEGDCMEIMSGLPEKCVDLVITDPPYSERTHSKARTYTGHDVTSTREIIDFTSMDYPEIRAAFTEMGRLTRRWVVSTVDYHHAFAMESDPPDGLRLLRIGIWVKPDGLPQISGDRPGMGWESIVFLHREDLRPAWSGGGRTSVWMNHKDRGKHHPAAKPQRMLRDWVTLFSEPGDIVLDPFAGSASTAVAAKAEGRRSLSIELDPQWITRARDRLAQGVLL